MITKEQHSIISHLAQHGDITRLEGCEILGMPTARFLDCVENLIYQGFVKARQIQLHYKGNRPRTTHCYSLTRQGQQLIDN